jgi:hypothetical protein
MNLQYTHTRVVQPLVNLLDAGVPLAVTAPLLLEDKFIIGYYSPTADSFGCAVIPAEGARTIYEPNTAVIKVHGLKRIWEVLGIGTRDVNLDKHSLQPKCTDTLLLTRHVPHRPKP